MPIFKPDEFLLNILPKKRLLGIDHGTKTLGIAISNSDMTVASPIKTIKRDKLKSDISKLISIFDEYEITAFSCWDAFSLEGFKKMQDIGVTTITTYPWMLYGVMNEAPVNEKIDAMHSFASDFFSEFK